MANSFLLYTANGSQTLFSLVGIDGWISTGFLKVYLNDVLQTTGYSLVDLNTATPKVQFTAAPAATTVVRLQRETPVTVAAFKSNIVDFSDNSVLTAADLDKVVEALIHVNQESEDTGSGALGKTLDQANWDANSRRITNMDPGIDENDAVTYAQLQNLALYGVATSVPQAWSLTGTGGTVYTLNNPSPLSTTEEMFIVEVGGVIQSPTTYTVTTNSITFDAAVGSGIPITVRNFGLSRSLNESVTTAMLEDDAVVTAKMANAAVTEAKLSSNSVTTAKIADDAVTYAKVQNVSATDKILGRSSSGAGNIEEIDCTLAGRALLDDATATDQRQTLGLGTLAIANTITNDDVAPGANVSFSKLQTVAANSLLGNNTASAATATSLNLSSIASLLGYVGTSAFQPGLLVFAYGTSSTSTSGDTQLNANMVAGTTVLPSPVSLSSISGQTRAGTFELFTGKLRITAASGGTWTVALVHAGTNWLAIGIKNT